MTIVFKPETDENGVPVEFYQTEDKGFYTVFKPETDENGVPVEFYNN